MLGIRKAGLRTAGEGGTPSGPRFLAARTLSPSGAAARIHGFSDALPEPIRERGPGAIDHYGRRKRKRISHRNRRQCRKCNASKRSEKRRVIQGPDFLRMSRAACCDDPEERQAPDEQPGRRASARGTFNQNNFTDATIFVRGSITPGAFDFLWSTKCFAM